MKIISFISNYTKISRLLNISGVCLEISSMGPEIWIVHKDCAIFLSYDTRISRLVKVYCLCGEIYGMCLKISRFVQISGVCPEISSMCPETLILQKYYIYFLSYDTTNFHIALVLGMCPKWLSMCQKISRFLKNFGTCLEIFQHVSGFFFYEDGYNFSIICHKKSKLLKFSGMYLEICHGTQRWY